MNKEQGKIFEKWLDRNLREFGEWNPDMVPLCEDAFEEGLNICTCDKCIRHNSQCFDVEEYYE